MVTQENIRALETVLGSSQFRSSPQLAAFLRYVAERTLAGRQVGIKSYTIAVEALGRSASFDPATDPIVRVEAGRLRQALTHYYDGDGRDDPVVITLPRGSYVPVFQPRCRSDTEPYNDGAGLPALLERLAQLHHQLEAVAAEIGRAWNDVERSRKSGRRRA